MTFEATLKSGQVNKMTMSDSGIESLAQVNVEAEYAGCPVIARRVLQEDISTSMPVRERAVEDVGWHILAWRESLFDEWRVALQD